MTQLASTPLSSTPAHPTIRCARGWAGPAAGPALRWLAASHLASHEPCELVVIPLEEAFALELVFARARGSAVVAAPAVVYDLSVAGCVLGAADAGGPSDYVVPTRLLAEVAETARTAAGILRGVAHRLEVADELDEAADELAGRVASAAGLAAPDRALAAHAPQIRHVAPPTGLVASLHGALEVIELPLLVELLPFGTGAEPIEGRLTRELVAELFGIAPSVRAVEAVVRANLSVIERNLDPLPVVAEAVLDDLAGNGLLELQLARLAVTRLAESLGECADRAVVRWARATDELLTTRLSTLAGHVTSVLEMLDHPAGTVGRSARANGSHDPDSRSVR